VPATEAAFRFLLVTSVSLRTCFTGEATVAGAVAGTAGLALRFLFDAVAAAAAEAVFLLYRAASAAEISAYNTNTIICRCYNQLRHNVFKSNPNLH